MRATRISYPSKRSGAAQHGFSVLELVVVMAMSVSMGTVAVLNLKALSNPLQSGSAQLSGFIKSVRARAISSTSAYTIEANGSGEVRTRRGLKCSDANPPLDAQTVLELPDGAVLSDTNWSFCINSVGMPDSNIEIGLQDLGGATKTVEVLLGGAVRVL